MPYRSRILCAGTTGTGKSTLAVRLLGQAPGPKVVIDPQGSSATLALPGVHTTNDPTGRTWRSDAETIRFVPDDPYDLDRYDDLYGTVRARIVEGVWPCAAVLCDEGELVLPANASTTSRRRKDRPNAGAARGLVYFGRKLSTLHITCSTRPKGVAMTVKANMSHGAFFLLPERADREAIATSIGVPVEQFETAMATAIAHAPGEPPKGYLWWDQARRTLYPRVLKL